jgi:hypothetical protein
MDKLIDPLMPPLGRRRRRGLPCCSTGPKYACVSFHRSPG